jgi:hypothetical protein
MARPLRVRVAGGWYHVMGRGRDRGRLFVDEVERFARKVRGRIMVHRETQGQTDLRRRRSFEEVVGMVERIKGERWDEFRDRYGDWGRDLALWAGRRYCGLTLRELGQRTGGLDYTAVAMAVRRANLRSRQDKTLRQAMRHVSVECAK